MRVLESDYERIDAHTLRPCYAILERDLWNGIDLTDLLGGRDLFYLTDDGFINLAYASNEVCPYGEEIERPTDKKARTFLDASAFTFIRLNDGAFERAEAETFERGLEQAWDVSSCTD